MKDFKSQIQEQIWCVSVEPRKQAAITSPLISWGMDVRNQRVQTSLEWLSQRGGQWEGQVGHVGGTVREWKEVGHASITEHIEETLEEAKQFFLSRREPLVAPVCTGFRIGQVSL